MGRDISGCVFRVWTGAFDLAAFGPTMFLVVVYISVSAVMAAGGFALTATHFFYKRLKKVSKKTLAPSVRPLAKARRTFAPVSIRGHCPPVCFATTYMQRVRLRRTALRATPRMNTSTQPPERGGWIKIKSCRRANARPVEWLEADVRRALVGVSLLAMAA
ncbi:hypothetical protein DJ564_26560 [Pseudomonas sp. 31-12]|nr:hypothetical protein DJ564_26560 [Pseudomonas sp. 31-12]